MASGRVAFVLGGAHSASSAPAVTTIRRCAAGGSTAKLTEVRTERIVFAVAAAAVVAHLVDHLTVGVKMDLQFIVVLAFGAVTVVAAVVYPRLSNQLQAMGSIALGLGWLLGDFVLHAVPAIRDGPRSTDYTGLGATVAGAMLIGVGIAAARRG